MRHSWWLGVFGAKIFAEEEIVRVASDIHAGSCWQGNTTALFRFLADTAKSNVSTLVLNGDVYDFWLLPLNQTHPTREEVLKNGLEPSLGFNMGYFRELLGAVAKNVPIVHEDVGNHDMWLDQNLARQAVGETSHLVWDQDKLQKWGMKFEHGHAHTLFNSPTPDGRLPMGYFVTRVVATYACLSQSRVSALIASAVNYILGTYVVNNFAIQILKNSYFFKKLLIHIIYSAGGKDMPDNLWKVPVTGVRDSFHRPLPHDSISNYTLAHFVEDYSSTVWQFYEKLGSQAVASMILADMNGNMLDTIVSRGSLDESVVITGHTHVPQMHLVPRDNPQISIMPDVLSVNAGAWVADDTGHMRHTYVDIVTDTIVDDYPECYTKPDGTDYKGRISWTQSGENCSAWNSLPIHSSAYREAFGGQAFCRNLGEMAVPWCYTGSFQWSFCDLPAPAKTCPPALARGPVRVELYTYPNTSPTKLAERKPSSSSPWRFIRNENHELLRTEIIV